jgi:hypothetical protein
VLKKDYPISADTFAALQLSALEFGGIGRGGLYAPETNEPWCIHGHALALGVEDDSPSVFSFLIHPLSQELARAGLRPFVQDELLATAGVKGNERISFERFCEITGLRVLDEGEAPREQVTDVLDELGMVTL